MMVNVFYMAKPAKQMEGLRFGKLLVLHRDGTSHTYAAWRVRCDCGTEKTVCGASLRNGSTKSCGCSFKSRKRYAPVRGNSTRMTYNSWRSMLGRCEDTSDPSYDRYGGRGVSVCPEWHEFQAFVRDMGERPSLDYSIDRYPDNNGDYEPSNCRWASRSQQATNRRSTHWITFNGHTKTLTEWGKDLGTTPATVLARLRHGWSTERAVTVPIQVRKPRSTSQH